MKKKRMMTTILCSLNTVILQWKIMKKKRLKNGHQMSPLMILVGSFLMQRENAKHEKEKEKLEHMLEDHKKLLYPNCEDGQKKLGTTLELLQWKAENGVLTRDLKSC